jgi:hypothetical protein
MNCNEGFPLLIWRRLQFYWTNWLAKVEPSSSDTIDVIVEKVCGGKDIRDPNEKQKNKKTKNKI